MRSSQLCRAVTLCAVLALFALANLPRLAAQSTPPEVHFDEPQRPRKIIFLCDVAAATVDPKAGLLTGELKKAITGLKPYQAFAVIFSGKNNIAFPKEMLAVAVPSNKADVMEFLAKLKLPESDADPVEAFRLAKAMQPSADLIYILTDHDWKDPAAVAQRVVELKGKTKINVVLFHATKETMFSDAMRKAAKSITQGNGFVNEVRESDIAGTQPTTNPASGGGIGPKS